MSLVSCFLRDSEILSYLQKIAKTLSNFLLFPFSSLSFIWSVSKQPTQLIVQLNSSLQHITVTKIVALFKLIHQDVRIQINFGGLGSLLLHYSFFTLSMLCPYYYFFLNCSQNCMLFSAIYFWKKVLELKGNYKKLNIQYILCLSQIMLEYNKGSTCIWSKNWINLWWIHFEYVVLKHWFYVVKNLNGGRLFKGLCSVFLPNFLELSLFRIFRSLEHAIHWDTY